MKITSEVADKLRKQSVTDVLGAIDALKEYVDRDTQNDLILLSARFHRLAEEKRRGTLSYENQIRMQTSILADFLDILRANALGNESAKPIPSPSKSQVMNPYENKLLSLIEENRRRDVNVANDARELLSKLREHLDQKAMNASYDLTNRRYNSIISDIDLFFIAQQETKKDNVDEFVKKITDLISEDAPSYGKLQEAYTLCQGRNLSSAKVELILRAQSPDRLAKIGCAEAIEELLSALV